MKMDCQHVKCSSRRGSYSDFTRRKLDLFSPKIDNKAAEAWILQSCYNNGGIPLPLVYLPRLTGEMIPVPPPFAVFLHLRLSLMKSPSALTIRDHVDLYHGPQQSGGKNS